MDRTFAALSNPIRRDIISRLTAGPERCTTFVNMFEISQQAVSRHIGVLAQAGLLKQRTAGRDRICELRHERLKEATDWMTANRRLWEERFSNFDALLKGSSNS